MAGELDLSTYETNIDVDNAYRFKRQGVEHAAITNIYMAPMITHANTLGAHSTGDEKNLVQVHSYTLAQQPWKTGIWNAGQYIYQ